MAAITATAVGGNYSDPASWVGGVVPTLAALDDITIPSTATIAIDTIGLGCRRISSLDGILTWVQGATTEFTVGDGLADNLITWGATGYFRAGTAATPLTGLHTLILNGSVASQAATANHFNMAACNTTTSGVSIVCDRTVHGVTESYTHPITGVVYNTRRNFSRIASVVNTGQPAVTFVEDLKLRAGGGDIVNFPGSHPTNNGQQNTPQTRTTASYNAGTLTATMTANFTTQVAVNSVAEAPTSGARGYSEASVFTIRAPSSAKYWGFTGSSSANPIFDLQNCTLKWFNGNANTFTQLNSKVVQGCVIIGPAVSVTNNAMGLRWSSQPIQFISCVCDSFVGQFGPQFWYNSFFCVLTRNADMYNVMGASDFYDCFFQDCIQVIANSAGLTFTRCGILQCNNSGGTLNIDTHFIATSTGAAGTRNIRPIYGRTGVLNGGNVDASRYFENPTFTGAINNLYADVTSRTSPIRAGVAGALQSPKGATAPSTIGFKLAPGGNTTAFTTPPDVIPAPPSGATVYNRLVTTAAIAPTFIGESFRPATHEYQFIVNSASTYSFTVPILAVSGYTPSSLTSIRLIITWANGTSVSTTVSGLTANVWNLTNVSGVAPVSGSATVSYYIQANIGNIYIDYPLDCDPAGYRWTNGVPQIPQVRLQDSSAGTIALAVRANLSPELNLIPSINKFTKLIPGGL